MNQHFTFTKSISKLNKMIIFETNNWLPNMSLDNLHDIVRLKSHCTCCIERKKKTF